MKRKFLKGLGPIFAITLLLAGCSNVIESSDDSLTQNILEQTTTVTSVETSIWFSMEARTGSAGSVDSHTASISSDITISSTFDPVAYYAELYSRILVDGNTTRETIDYYVVPEGNDYIRYSCTDTAGEWQRSTLSRAEILAIPLYTGFPSNWEEILSAVSEVNEIEGESEDEEEAALQYEMVGKINSSIIQEFFANKVFGSFTDSMERLLSEEIPFTLLVDGETYLPQSITIDFTDCFTVTDMSIDVAEISVSYSKYNTNDEISVPKKVSVVAEDHDADFYASFFAWNLFLPYINGDLEEDTGNAGNSGLSFISSWDTYQVRIDDGMTKLPLEYADLNNLGYTIDSAVASTIIEPNSYQKNIPIYKGTDKLICTLYNPMTTPQPITSCVIGSIDCAAANILQNGIHVYLPGEVTLGITRDALVSAYGDPDETITGFASDTLIWKGATDNQSFIAEISPATSLVIRLCLTNILLAPTTTGVESAPAV